MSTLAALNQSLALSSAQTDFVWYAKSLLAANSGIGDAERWLEAHHKSPRLKEFFIQQKTAVDPGTLSGSDWAGPLVPYKLLSDGFVASMGAFSAFDRLLSDNAFMRVPMRTRIAIATAGAQGSSVSEGASKPTARMTFGSLTLEAAKSVSYIIVSDELARNAQPSAVALLGQELARAVGIETDLVFLDAIAAGASLTHASSGTTASAFLFDLNSALQGMQLGANSKIYFIAGADVIKSLAMTLAITGNPLTQLSVTGGTVAGIKFVVSNAASDAAYVVDATQVAADNDLITLDRSTQASVQMDSAPGTPPTGVTSLWQMNLVGLRAERFFGCQLLRSTGAALISGMSTTA